MPQFVTIIGAVVPCIVAAHPHINDMVNRSSKTLGHGVIDRTRESLLKIEDWLDDNIAGKWSIGIEGLDDKLQQKTIKIVFYEADDKRKFMRKYGGRLMVG